MENLTPEQVVDKVGELFNEKMANVPTTEDVKALKSELDSLKGLEEKSQDIEKAIAKFEGRLEAMSEKAQEPKVEKLGLAESMFKTYKDNLEAIKDAVEKGGKLNLSTKDTTITADYTGTYALLTLILRSIELSVKDTESLKTLILERLLENSLLMYSNVLTVK